MRTLPLDVEQRIAALLGAHTSYRLVTLEETAQLSLEPPDFDNPLVRTKLQHVRFEAQELYHNLAQRHADPEHTLVAVAQEVLTNEALIAFSADTDLAMDNISVPEALDRIARAGVSKPISNLTYVFTLVAKAEALGWELLDKLAGKGDLHGLAVARAIAEALPDTLHLEYPGTTPLDRMVREVVLTAQAHSRMLEGYSIWVSSLLTGGGDFDSMAGTAGGGMGEGGR